MIFDDIPIYVVTTKALTERHEHIRALETRIGVKFEFILDYDTDSLTPYDQRKIKADMPPPSVSCLLKHFEAQRRFLMTKSDICIVLEDDVILFDEFELAVTLILSRYKHLPPGWLIFLGGADNKIDPRFLGGDSFALVESPLSTAEIYMLDRLSCIKRSEWIDNHGLTKPADHQLTFMDREMGITHYRLKRPVATQGSITGQFPTTLDDSRRKRSALFLYSKYRWNRFRRQYFPRLIATIFGRSR